MSEKLLRILFLITIPLSIVGIHYFMKTGGACNAGVLFLGMLFFLTVFSTMSFLAIVTRKEYPVLSIILILLALVLWGALTIMAITETPREAPLAFLPLLILELLIAAFIIKNYKK